MPLILNGVALAERLQAKLQASVKACAKPPTLAIVQVGNRSDSNAYIARKILFAKSIGVEVLLQKFGEEVEGTLLTSAIRVLNEKSVVNGIIVQLPIPATIPRGVIDSIDSKKDVDAQTAPSLKRLWSGDLTLIPATTRGILTLLDYYKIEISGRRAVVVGRSMLVGKPTAAALLARGATVTIAHRGTKDLAAVTRSADILVVATGSPKLISRSHVSSGVSVVDVGINVSGSSEKLEEEITSRKIVGDVDFEAVKDVVAAISPVPGGVGPMTVAALFENLLECAKVDMKM